MTNKEFLILYGQHILVDRREGTVVAYFSEYEQETIPFKERQRITKAIKQWLDKE